MSNKFKVKKKLVSIALALALAAQPLASLPMNVFAGTGKNGVIKAPELVKSVKIKDKSEMPRVVFYDAKSSTLPAPELIVEGGPAHTLKWEVVEGNENKAVNVDGNGQVTINGSKYEDNTTHLVKIKVTANNSKSDSYELLIVKTDAVDNLLSAAAVEITKNAVVVASLVFSSAVNNVVTQVQSAYTAGDAAIATAAAKNATDQFLGNDFAAAAGDAAYYAARATRAAAAAAAAIATATTATTEARWTEDVLGWAAAGAIKAAKEAGFDPSENNDIKDAPAVKYVDTKSGNPFDNNDEDSAVISNLKAAQVAAEFAEEATAKDAGKAKAAKIARAAANACQVAAYAYKDIKSNGVNDDTKARIAHMMFEVVEYWKLIF